MNRRIIFGVWDSGGEAVDRDQVADANRVTLVAKGEDVFSGSFGNEGTGGHSHLKFPWETGKQQRFLVTAKAGDSTKLPCHPIAPIFQSKFTFSPPRENNDHWRLCHKCPFVPQSTVGWLRSR